MTETRDITTPLRDRIRELGIFCERTNCGNVPTRGGRIWLWDEGAADLVGRLPGRARFYGIETKAKKGKLRKAQIAWRERLLRDGGRWAKAESVAEGLEALTQWLSKEGDNAA